MRTKAIALDRIIGKKYKVLDRGFVRVIDYMGTDESIVQAARVSYGKGTKSVSGDRGLIRYLMRHRHTTPFEMCELKLHVRVPMDCWRQWIRHRTASVNEYSTRYSVAMDDAQITNPSAWRSQARINKQGSADFLPRVEGGELSRSEQKLQLSARSVYLNRLKAGVAREQARKDLPLSTYTEAYWKINLHNLFHFLSLRMDSHAQLEIRSYANVIGKKIVKAWCPVAWEAFEEYRLGSVSLSRLENDLMVQIINGKGRYAISLAKRAGILKKGKSGYKRSRERAEIESKLDAFGLKIPWV